ncbi:MAG: alpha/beta hydrolase [Anderseniella sp.]
MKTLVLAFLTLFCIVTTPASSRSEPAEHTYCRNGGQEQKLDLYKSAPGIVSPGTIIYIHGGGYTEGDKRSGFELRRAKLLTQFGFSVVSINYRLAPQAVFPAQYADAGCAVKYLYDNATRLGINMSWLGVMGDSAGGHLAALLGVTSDLGPGVPVSAIVAFYGAYDLVNMEKDTLLPQAIASALPTKELRSTWSPIRYVTRNDPPFLLIHGKQDKFVSVAQSVKFALALKKAGHEPLLAVVENAGHGLVERTGSINPDAATIDKLMVGFFLKSAGRK